MRRLRPTAIVALALPVTAAAALLLATACGGDTYCQSGPRYGTQCYGGMTVRERDPNAPVAPLPPPTAHQGGGVTSWISREPARDAAPPEMFGRRADAGPEAGGDASDAASADGAAP